MRAWHKWSALGLIAIVAGMQLFRPARTNPPEDQTHTIYAREAMTESVSVILKKSCNDCHSSQTIWPWYTNIAPVSWIIASHVNEGRAELNFSDWGSYSAQDRRKLLGEICEQSTSRDMPGIFYTSVHANTRLSDSDIQSVCAWTNTQREPVQTATNSLSRGAQVTCSPGSLEKVRFARYSRAAAESPPTG